MEMGKNNQVLKTSKSSSTMIKLVVKVSLTQVYNASKNTNFNKQLAKIHSLGQLYPKR